MSDLMIPSNLDFDELRKQGRRPQPFHANLRLLQPTSPDVSTKGIPAGTWMMGDQRLGTRLKVVAINKRDHAIHIKNGKKIAESYDKNSDVFKKICLIKNTPTEEGRAGADWLFYIPDLAVFVTYLAGKTSNVGVTYTLADHLQPPETRKTDVALLHTNCFELYSVYKDGGPKYKCFEAKVDAVPVDTTWYPNKDDVASAVAIFFKPLTEPTTEEEAETVDR